MTTLSKVVLFVLVVALLVGCGSTEYTGKVIDKYTETGQRDTGVSTGGVKIRQTVTDYYLVIEESLDGEDKEHTESVSKKKYESVALGDICTVKAHQVDCD